MPIAGFNLGKYSRVATLAGNVPVEVYATSGVERSFPKGTAEALAADPIAPFRPRQPPDQLAVTPLAPSPARNAQMVANRSARAVDFFAHRFGPYPYSTWL